MLRRIGSPDAPQGLIVTCVLICIDRSVGNPQDTMTQPRLLQQMHMLMGNWKPDPPSGEPTPAGEGPLSSWERRMMNQSTADAVLKLYIASSGLYEPLLRQLQEFQTNLIDDLHSELQQTRNAAAVYQSRLQATGAITDGVTEVRPRSSADGELSDRGLVADKCDYAFGRVETVEQRMAGVVAESQARRNADEARIAALERDVASLEEQLKDQIQKVKRAAKDPDAEKKLTREELTHERVVINLERALAAEKRNVEDRDDSISQLGIRIKSLMELNGKYARQAMELAARVRVYSEHNDKFATLLSMQHDEKIQTDKENELLRKELIDLNQFHQLRENLEGDGGTVTHSVDMRGIRYGLGMNPTVPRHLQFSGLINRVPMGKEAAVTMIADILTQRQSPAHSRHDFATFVHQYMTRRHEAHAVAWSYSLDEATRLYDSDVNLNLFGLVSRRKVPELIYRDMSTDQQIFLAGCEIMDAMQHQSLRLTVPVPHIIGLLIEMFPGYPDGAFRKIIEHLHSTLTSNGQAHYRMLFPNMERDEFQSAEMMLAQVDIRRENHFSQGFKELIVDDAAVTLQQIEDELHRVAADKITTTDVKELVAKLFTLDSVAREVQAMLLRIVHEFHGTVGGYSVTMPKSTFITLLRTKAPVRKGVYRLDGGYSSSPARARPLMNLAAGKGEVGQMVLSSLAPIDYRDVLQSIPIKRVSYITDEDLKREEEEKRRLEFEAAKAEAAAANAESPHGPPPAATLPPSRPSYRNVPSKS
jgi:hypothetical protein